jgi:hypothetical protein
MAGIGRDNLGSIRLAVNDQIKAKAVHAALDKIMELSGCKDCGFLGILDVHLTRVNPPNELGIELPGVLGVGGHLGGR